MKIHKNTVYIIFLALAVFALSQIVFSYYTLGDQVYYRILYERMDGASIWKILSIGQSTLHGSEPISLFFFWVGKNLSIEYIIFESTLNALFTYYLVKFLIKNDLSFGLIILILLNGYIFTLFFGLPRLKIAFLLILFFISSQKNFLDKLSTLSIFAHYSIAIIFIAHFYIGIVKNKFKIFFLKRYIFYYFILFLIIISGAFFLKEFIAKKILGYSDKPFKLYDLIQFLFIILFTYFLLGKKYALKFAIIFVIPLMVLGGFRVNMLMFILIMYYFFTEGNIKKINFKNFSLKNLSFLFFLIYGVYKTLIYVKYTVLYGQAFHII